MKYLLSLFSLTVFIVLPQMVHAATVSISHVPSVVAQQQQFYVDITIDPEGKTFNALQGAVVFSDDTISFVRAETGSSNITFFIDPPAVKGNRITFSGIIPGGFSGLIDPFDSAHKNPGQIVRLVFVGKAAGEGRLAVTGLAIADNDGHGTLESVADQQMAFSVSGTVAPSVYFPQDTVAPTVTASVVKDANLNNGKYTLIFNAVDKQSGIDHVDIKEGGGDWHTIQSPYLLQDQSRQSILLIRAVDVAGNSGNATIPPVRRASSLFAVIVALIFLLSIILYVIKKKSQHTS